MKEKPLHKKPLFLCGMMGTGKSTVGRVLAGKLKVPFADLDEMIEKQAGKTIPEIFEGPGEEVFRKMERNLLVDVTQHHTGVLALGGGSLQNQQLVDHTKDHGCLVFLHTPVDEITSRLQVNTNRPVLNSSKGVEIKSQISELLKQRLPFYKQAHITIDAGGKSAKEIALEIIHKLKLNDA